MKRAKELQSGMTLIEMLAAISVLVILMAILAEVFLAASKAAAQGRSLAEIYQVDRALRSLMARDLSGAPTESQPFFESRENGLVGLNSRLAGLPPGPYSLAGYPAALPAQMNRMLMGGSDYLVFTSCSVSRSDKGAATVFYVLRESGQFIRVSFSGVSDFVHYGYNARENGKDPYLDGEMNDYEETRVIAENVERVKFSFLDRGTQPLYVNGVWVDDWDWASKGYVPAAVKVELQLVDHLWNLSNGNKLSNKDFDPTDPTKVDDLRASETFDPDDGEAFTFIVDIALGTK
jgi:prepilin-type N-terminal cleavage/methylation domain-containing protein